MTIFISIQMYLHKKMYYTYYNCANHKFKAEESAKYFVTCTVNKRAFLLYYDIIKDYVIKVSRPHKIFSDVPATFDLFKRSPGLGHFAIEPEAITSLKFDRKSVDLSLMKNINTLFGGAKVAELADIVSDVTADQTMRIDKAISEFFDSFSKLERVMIDPHSGNIVGNVPALRGGIPTADMLKFVDSESIKELGSKVVGRSITGTILNIFDRFNKRMGIAKRLPEQGAAAR